MTKRQKALFKELLKRMCLPTDLTEIIGAEFEFYPAILPRPKCYTGEITGVELHDDDFLLLHIKVDGQAKKVRHAILCDPVTKQWYWQSLIRQKLIPIDFPGHDGKNCGNLCVSWPRRPGR
jgi:hypothetical protein